LTQPFSTLSQPGGQGAGFAKATPVINMPGARIPVMTATAVTSFFHGAVLLLDCDFFSGPMNRIESSLQILSTS
jgi:hypothetical protein